MGCVLISFLFLAVVHTSTCVYRFEGNPFQQYGPLAVDTLTLGDDVPVHTEVYYPTVPGTYTPILFIPGFNGVVYPAFYSTVISNFASYGYVIAAIDLYWPAAAVTHGVSQDVGRAEVLAKMWNDTQLKREQREEIMKSNPEKTFELLQWMESKLVSKIFPNEGVYNVTVDWSRLGLLAHSSGADTLIRMLQQNSNFTQAVAFLEPYSNHLKDPLKTTHVLPSLSYGTELCMQFPPCCIKGMSYLHFYQNLFCPRILMNIQGYGHCDILDEYPGWDLCHVSDFCKTNSDNNRRLYREVFVPGVLSAFFGQYLQGNPNLVKLITQADYMPVQLSSLENNLNCVSH